MNVISLGAGVQSTTLLLQAWRGMVGPKPDAAIFADTGWEPPAVYAHLAWLEATIGADIPIVRVESTLGSLRAHTLRRLAGQSRETAKGVMIPFYCANPDGTFGIMRRQCTNNFKVRPIQQWIRRQLRERGETQSVIWFGISTEELYRVRDSRVRYLRNRYPLIEARMNRTACLLWLEQEGYPRPPKSACMVCPFHDDEQWQVLRADPETWQEVLWIDQAIRRRPDYDGEMFLHSRRRPLAEIDLRTPAEQGQLSLWNQECTGYCGN